MEQEIIPKFTKEDFEQGTGPYEYLYGFRDDGFVLEQRKAFLQAMAKELKVTGFIKRFNEYVKRQKAAQRLIAGENVTMFEGQPFELITGEWTADDSGVTAFGEYGNAVTVCNHPIMPVRRLINIDTGAEKLEIAFRKGARWRTIIADRKTIASANSIVGLSEFGIGVTSENAKYLVRYLYDVEHLNYDLLNENNSVSRLGWIDGEGFSPYVQDLVFDGGDQFKSFFAAVSQRGDAEIWLKMAREIRRSGSIPARIILASSFASVLVKPVEALSFFVHLWGSESGVGKTIGLMLAASVWANPEMGKYIHTFNGTQVSQELYAGFVNSMPLILDEFQVLKDKKAFEQSVYMLSEGVGKGRGAKSGGVQQLQTWRNCILTSGEMPITNFVVGAGAVNRIMEIECTQRLFRDPQKVLSVLRNNYGHAGKEFVELLQEGNNMERARKLYEQNYNGIVQSETTEKQAMAGSLILTADQLITDWIFYDGNPLRMEDISEYMRTKTEVDVNERAYDYICETVAANANRFTEEDNNGEVWGILDAGHNRVYILRTIFERICEAGEFSSRATLSWMMRKNIIETSVDKRRKGLQPTISKKIGKTNNRCVSMKLQSFSENDGDIPDIE